MFVLGCSRECVQMIDDRRIDDEGSPALRPIEALREAVDAVDLYASESIRMAAPFRDEIIALRDAAQAVADALEPWAVEYGPVEAEPVHEVTVGFDDMGRMYALTDSRPLPSPLERVRAAVSVEGYEWVFGGEGYVDLRHEGRDLGWVHEDGTWCSQGSIRDAPTLQDAAHALMAHVLSEFYKVC